jgi:hypothetical protein
MVTRDLETLQRWEIAGGTWRLERRRGDTVTIALCRCDGGEEVDRLVSAEPALREYVERAADAG